MKYEPCQKPCVGVVILDLAPPPRVVITDRRDGGQQQERAGGTGAYPSVSTA